MTGDAYDDARGMQVVMKRVTLAKELGGEHDSQIRVAIRDRCRISNGDGRFDHNVGTGST